MKRVLILALLMVFCGALQAQNNKKFYGTYDFTTVTGEVGYETGEIVITEDKVVFTFAGNSFKYPSDWVKYENDSLKFEFDVDGTLVDCYLVVKDAKHLTGYADWEYGETVLNLTRKKE